MRGGVGPLDRRFGDALSEFARAHPAIEIALREDNRERVLASVASGDVGIAQVCVTGEYVPPSVQVRVVGADPLVLAASPGHRFASRRRVTVDDLAGEPLVTLVEGTGLRMAVDRACRAAGFSPHVVADTTEIRSLLDLTAAGLGVAVVPRSVGDDPRLAVVEFTPRIDRLIGLAWNEATSPAARAFLALAESRFDDEGATVTPLAAASIAGG